MIVSLHMYCGGNSGAVHVQYAVKWNNYTHTVHLRTLCSVIILLHVGTLYLAPLKTALPQPLCFPQDLLQWQLELAPCEAHLHLWGVN